MTSKVKMCFNGIEIGNNNIVSHMELHSTSRVAGPAQRSRIHEVHGAAAPCSGPAPALVSALARAWS